MEKRDIHSNQRSSIRSQDLASDDGCEAVGNAEEQEWEFVFSGQHMHDLETIQPQDKITASHATIIHKTQTQTTPKTVSRLIPWNSRSLNASCSILGFNSLQSGFGDLPKPIIQRWILKW